MTRANNALALLGPLAVLALVGLVGSFVTAARAIEFTNAHAPVGRDEIVVEVDRYIGMPGQALAYKVGQREILRLRDEARTKLGPGFDIRAFHDAVLGGATVSLRVLRDRVASWAGGGQAPGTGSGTASP